MNKTNGMLHFKTRALEFAREKVLLHILILGIAPWEGYNCFGKNSGQIHQITPGPLV